MLFDIQNNKYGGYYIIVPTENLDTTTGKK